MTKNETFQAIFHLYETEHEHAPSRTRDAVDWAISQGLLATPPPIDPCEALANQMSKVLACIIQCAVTRRHSSAGANPARRLSLQPVAVGADDGGNDIG